MCAADESADENALNAPIFSAFPGSRERDRTVKLQRSQPEKHCEFKLRSRCVSLFVISFIFRRIAILETVIIMTAILETILNIAIQETAIQETAILKTAMLNTEIQRTAIEKPAIAETTIPENCLLEPTNRISQFRIRISGATVS